MNTQESLLDVVNGNVAGVAALVAALVALLVELEANIALTTVAIRVGLVDLGVLGQFACKKLWVSFAYFVVW